MAKNYKYIVAANGTYHLFNNDKQASYCGRVKPGQEGVRLTSLLPKGKALETLKTCARDTQLSNGLLYGVSVSNTVKDVPGVGKVAVVTTEAPETSTPAPAKRRGRKAAVVASEGADDASTVTVKVSEADDSDVAVYDSIIDFLLANEVSAVINTDLAGKSLLFDAAGYAYQVWAPTWNANGPDEGWIIQYNDDPASHDPGYAEPMLTSGTDVIAWLADDLGFTIPKPKRGRKATQAKVVESSADNGSTETAKRLVSSHLVTIQSNAVAAYQYATEYGGVDQSTIDTLTDMAKLADKLRKSIQL